MSFEAFRDDLLRIAQQKGCAAAEVYAQEGRNFSMEVMDQEIDSYTVSRALGLSLRVELEGKNGYAYTELLEQPETLVERAMDNARASEDDDPHPMQGESVYPQVVLPENPLAGMTDAQCIDLAMELDRLTSKADPRYVRTEGSGVEWGTGTIRVANTRGLRASREISVGLIAAIPILQEGEDQQSGFAFRSGKAASDLEGCAKEAVQEAARRFGASTVPSGNYRVLLEKRAASALLQGFCSMFSGEAAQKGLSLLADKEGQAIAAANISIVDDPLMAENPRPFDDEGVPSVRTQVVENGVLRTLLHNLKTAAKAGCASTSNGGRAGAASKVSVAPSNFYIVPGGTGFDQLKTELGDGLIIRDISGLHAGLNPISGDFSLLADGWLQTDGQLRPVNQITVAGNFLTLMKDIVTVGDDLWMGFPRASRVGSPSLLIGGLSVSGS